MRTWFISRQIHCRRRPIFIRSQVWNPASIPGKANAEWLDPNYLKTEQFARCPWHAFVRSWMTHHHQNQNQNQSDLQPPVADSLPLSPSTPLASALSFASASASLAPPPPPPFPVATPLPVFHLDIHGRHDHDAPRRLDLGMAPMTALWTDRKQVLSIRQNESEIDEED